MHYLFYRYALLSTTALRQLVCALEGLVIVQFWLTSPVAWAMARRLLRTSWGVLPVAHFQAHGVQAVWLVMAAVIALAFGVLLALHWLLPAAVVAETTEADVQRLLEVMDTSGPTGIGTAV